MPITLDYTPIDVTKDTKHISIGDSDMTILNSNEYHPGWVGLGWNLTAGGVISRTLNGIPDETENTGNFSNNDITFNPFQYPIECVSHETGEDEFAFNFCGYSGTFIYYRGTWEIYSDADFKVNTTIKNDGAGNNVLTGFILETPDGTSYSFGDSYTVSAPNAVEYTNYTNGTLSNITSSWFLTRIESPDGDQVNFNYGSSGYTNYVPITKQCKISSQTKYVDYEGYPRQTGIIPVSTFPTDQQVIDLSVGCWIQSVYLTGISSPTSHVSIQFNRSASKGMDYPGSHPGSKSYKLDNINFLADYKSFKKFDLTYIENPTETLKLQSVQESGVSTDGTTTSLPSYQFVYLPNADPVAPAVLSKITYPTGGFSSFEFEKNDYSAYYDIQQQGVFGQLLIPEGTPPTFQNQSDGFRIKDQVSKSSDTDKAQTTNYYYTDYFPELNPALAYKNGSTGIQNMNIMTERTDNTFSRDNSGQLYTYYMTEVTDYDCSYPNERANSTIRNSMVGYSSVWVVQSKEGVTTKSSLGYTNYKFINYISAIQNSDGSTSYINNNINVAGKITSCVKYNAKKSETSRIEYEYENGTETDMLRYYVKPVTYMDFDTKQPVTNSLAVAYNTKYFRYNLGTKTISNYNFQKITDYTYDDITNNLTEMSVTEPRINYASIPADAQFEDGDYSTTTTTYRYIDEFNAPSPGYFSLDAPNHIKNLPVEKVVKKDGKVISAEFTKYTITSYPSFNLVRPYQVYALEISSPITDYIQPATDWSIADTRYKLKTTFDLYDSNGNLLQYHNEGSAPVSYYYDFENDISQLQSIEIRNSTYDAYNTGFNPAKPGDMLTLRKQLPNAQITSYTYDPKFGITSVTSPNGVTTYKEYDVFGRLKNIKDNNQNILQIKEYDFNIQ